MSINLNLFVAYFASAQNKLQLEQSIENFISAQPHPTEIKDKFIELPENSRSNKWLGLKKAIEFCEVNQATLLIAELGVLTNKEDFVNTLLNSSINFYCLDQPFVDRGILKALYEHSRVQKKVHGRLIKAGLEKTTAKSGNPNASEVISQVNKPKIDAAIVFAFLLQPIVSQYKQQGFSQREMVKSLNEEGFTAPEGGKWVLSQLQKVLDRVKMNEIVIQTKDIIQPLVESNKNLDEIAAELNSREVPSFKKSGWDSSQVSKVLFRLEQINDIEAINKAVISLLPLVHEFKDRNYTAKEILQYFENNEIKVNA